MDEDQWIYESIMFEEVNMNEDNREEPSVSTHEDILECACIVAYDIGFVATIMRRGKTSFVLIGSERSEKYRAYKKNLVQTVNGSMKKSMVKLVLGGEGWMMNLICETHNHALAKSFFGHLYAGRLTKNEKIIIGNMTKSMVKSKNIFLALKEHDANKCTIMKQEEDVVRDIFWTHSDALELSNSCNLVFLIDNTYKTNRYRLHLLDIIGMTPIGMTFLAAFAYLEGEHIKNVVQALEQFRGIFMRCDTIPQVNVID
ncbi:hypothetical protein GmHk_10G028440 [Glycine max]|nr:hypothetical protein GmHk_10G028440 [Glycine max]